ncbi:TPA: twin-arginine translocase subunit TatB [Vibrio cholerae]|nr:twin-arginine translocase subunit TatB [Vibrio cholerae]
MFDVGIGELTLISIIAIIVIGPERLPDAIRHVSRIIGATKRTINNIKDEFSEDLDLIELKAHISKTKQLDMDIFSSELKTSAHSVNITIEPPQIEAKPKQTIMESESTHQEKQLSLNLANNQAE